MSQYQENQSISQETAAIAVVRVDNHFRVAATRPLAQDTLLLHLEGTRVPQATRYSVQVGLSEHVDAAKDKTHEAALDLYPWRCLNHSCRPNAYFRGHDLLALRKIEAWEQITFDYNTTEFELATPFACSCGAAQCCGLVRGFRHLTVTEQVRRASILADYLCVFLNEAG